MRVALSWSVTISLLFLGCDSLKKEEKEEEEKTSGKTIANIVLLEAEYPSNQTSPVQDPTKIGTVTTFRVMPAEDSLELSYKDSDFLWSILTFDDQGQWINTDRDLKILITSSNKDVQILAAATGVEISEIAIPKGSPSGMFKVLGTKPGEASLRFAENELDIYGDIAVSVVVRKPEALGKNAGSYPTVGTCTLQTVTFGDTAGHDAFFSLEKETLLAVESSGCAYFSDAECKLPLTNIVVPADSKVSEPFYVKPSAPLALATVTSSSGFSAEYLCSVD